MDIQNVLQQVLGAAAKNPDLLANLVQHPYSTIGNITGNENVSKEEASQVVAATSQLAAGNPIDFGNLATFASGLLANNGGSVHNLANAILGNGSSQGVDISQGVPTDMLASMAKAVNLTNGIGLDDILGIAGVFLGKK